jgi:hypothetical protein
MNTNPLAEGRRADSARRRQRVTKAINTAKRDGTTISVSGIARQAGVDRAFLYRHKDLLAQVHAAGSEPPGNDTSPAVSRASLQADLANAQDRGNRLATRVRHRPSSPNFLASRPGESPGSGHLMTSNTTSDALPRWNNRSST